MAKLVNVPADVIRRQIGSVFERWGMSKEHSDMSVHVMVETDLRGIDSHGLGMLPMYQEWMTLGLLNPKPDIRVTRDMGAIALIEADRSLGHPPSVIAMRLAMKKAREFGVGVVAVGNSNHYGAAGHYSLMASDEGLIGMAMTSAPSRVVVPTFAREPMYGTNPIAFTAPAKRNKAFSLDMATSTVAFGKVQIARRARKPIPEGWALDDQGRPETDPVRAIQFRRATPLGGNRALGSHKGYGLAMMVEILCSTLTGSWVAGRSFDGKRPDGPRRKNVGHFFMAMDPAKFRDGDDFGNELDGLMDSMRATPPIDPAQPVLMAGDPEYAEYERRSKDGIPVTDTLLEEVREVCKTSGAKFILQD